MGNISKNPRGKNIAETLSPNSAPKDKRVEALRHTMMYKSLCTSRCTTAEELDERFKKLFEMCANDGFIPTVEALCVCSGIDRKSLWDIENENRYKGSGMSNVIKSAKTFISTLEAELARDGTINPTVYIFRAKNYYGMSDKQEVVVTPNTSFNAPINEAQILENIPKLDDK